MKKTAIILVNLGTPEAPTKKKVGRFLSEFLNDPLVIDLPYLARIILVNLIIIPFRVGKSTKMYEKIWTEKGSPIIINSNEFVDKLNKSDNPEIQYFLAMRYGNPSIKSVLEIVRQAGFGKILIIPLFPLYASSTNLSVIKECEKIMGKWPDTPEIRYIDYFYNHESFLSLWKNRLRSVNIEAFEHILFAFHGLPVRQVEQFHQKMSCSHFSCETQISDENKYCYNAQCYDISRILAFDRKIESSKYTVCFQSRFGKNWLSPFADKVIIEKAKQGIKKILVIPLSFVADCLETKLEIEIEYAHLFREHGGNELIMVESLNADKDWVDAIKRIASESLT